MNVSKRCQTWLRELQIHEWHGGVIKTLRREAILWFAIIEDKETKTRLEQFWERDDRFTTSVAIELEADGTSRTLRLHPLPHPSPLNATWYKRFPDLLGNRLGQLKLSSDNWRMT